MRIAVIAANGRTGKVFVEQALAAGHIVRAGVHSANDLVDHVNLETIKCDATNISDISKLLENQEAVVSFIGHGKNSPASLQTDAIQAAIQAMKLNKVKRIVSLTGTGVRFPGDQIDIVDRFLNYSILLIDRPRIEDGIAHVELLKSSGLDWTAIRVLKLQNTRLRAFSLKEHGPGRYIVSRREVAQAVLEVLENQSFIGQGPIICRP